MSKVDFKGGKFSGDINSERLIIYAPYSILEDDRDSPWKPFLTINKGDCFKFFHENTKAYRECKYDNPNKYINLEDDSYRAFSFPEIDATSIKKIDCTTRAVIEDPIIIHGGKLSGIAIHPSAKGGRRRGSQTRRKNRKNRKNQKTRKTRK